MTSSNSQHKQVALVTGASSGIGRVSAHALAEAGFAVVGTSRSAARVEPLPGVTFVDLDVTSDASVEAAVADVIGRFGRIDVLVNNAGLGLAGAAEESSMDQVETLFDTNVFGLIRVTNAVLTHMRAQGSGRVVNISSVLGFLPAPYMAIYAATKHAVEGYTESIDHEVRQHGIRVLLVEPGYTSTDFEANSAWSDRPIPAYDDQRRTAAKILSAAMKDADSPSVVATKVVEAATAARPRGRYPAGPLAARVSLLRRFVPRVAFDKQIRKLNQLPA
jgi:NAD(P)-dependent dehydrogenase (short-subunit alcohol dehydrogenase family)